MCAENQEIMMGVVVVRDDKQGQSIPGFSGPEGSVFCHLQPVRRQCGALGAVLSGLSVLLLVLLPVAAQAQANPCGEPAGDPPKVTCDAESYPVGIQYVGSGSGIESALELTVAPPSGGTTITATAGNRQDGIRIYAQRDVGEPRTPITVNVMGGTIQAGHYAVNISQRPKSQGALTVTTGSEARLGTQDSYIKRFGIRVRNANVADTSDIGVVNAADIYADGVGIYVWHKGPGAVSIVNTGDITVWDRDNSHDQEVWGRGIYARNDSAGETWDDSAGTGKGISIVSSGNITLYGAPTIRGNVPVAAILAVASRFVGNNNMNSIPVNIDVTGGTITSPAHGVSVGNQWGGGTSMVKVKVAGGVMIDAGYNGIRAVNRGRGEAEVVVDSGAMVTGGKDGVYFDSSADKNMQKVTIMGTVTGGGNECRRGNNGKCAGVMMKSGGTLVVGPEGQVKAASGVGVETGDNQDLTIVLQRDEDGLTGNIEGQILNSGGTTTFQGVTMGEPVDMHGESMGIFDIVYRTMLTELQGGGFEFRRVPGTESRVYAPRARVYEALPSVLLDLNGHIPYRAAQTVVTRAGDGVGAWARVGGGDGRRRMDESTTSKDYRGKELVWDFSHYGIEAGVDIPVVDKPLLLGLSLHHRQGQAVVQDGGKIEVSGTGVGVSAMLRNETGLYVDGRFSYTGFHDIDTNSSERGTLKSDFTGMGYGVDVEGGRRVAVKGMDGVTLTPRGGLSWSSVDIDDFDDLAGIQDGGRVSPGSATSLKGRLGVLAETGFGGTGAREGRLFASLDVEHEFSSDRDVTASGTKLSSEAEATWGRFRLGGTMSWNSVVGMVTFSGEGFYASAGDEDNHDFGGGVGFDVRF